MKDLTITDQSIINAYNAAEKALDAVRAAARTIAISGALLLEKKAGLEHGEWLPWLKANQIGEDSAQRHMNVARAVMSTLQIPHSAVFGDLTFAQCLSLPPADLPPMAQKAREKFEECVANKSAKQLTFDWRAREKYVPTYHPPKRTEEQQRSARLEGEMEVLEALIHAAEDWRARTHWKDVLEAEGGRAALEALQAAFINGNKALTVALKRGGK